MNGLFITGGSGLLALNWAVTMRDNSRIILGLYDRTIDLSGVETKFLELESIDEITDSLSKSNVQIVIHTAGLTSVEACEANPELAKHINSDLSSNVAKACNRLGLKLIHISTDHLFSGVNPLTDEDYHVDPINVYGYTKAEAEIRVLEACPSALIIRTNFYGWGPGYRSSFSDIIINTLRSGKELFLFQDVFYTPILAETLVLIVHELVKRQASGIYNIVGDERLSKFEFGLRIAKQFKLNSTLIKPVSIANKPELVRRPLDLSLSNKKTCDFLGINFGDINMDILRLYSQEKLSSINELRKL